MKLDLQWDELAPLWNRNDFGAVHDWLGARWNHLIQERPDGQADQDAKFLQGLAFAALAFHFTQHHNQEGAALLAQDALDVLAGYLPAYHGVAVAPILDTLNTLAPLLAGLEPEAECPMNPFVCNKFSYQAQE
jgi:hypothetical protein